MARRIRFKKNFSIGRVITKLVITLLSLYVGGTIMTAIGDVMNGTTSVFYNGLTLIGWTVSSGLITDTTGSGVLTVVGIVGIASIVMEFVEVKMM